MSRGNINFVTGRIGPTLLGFIVPIMCTNVIQQLYTTVDRIIVGRFVSKEGLAAVGVSFPIIFLLSTLLMGTFMGSTILLGHATGANNRTYARKVVDTTYLLAGIIAFCVTIVGLLSSAPLLRLLGVAPAIFIEADRYLSILFLGFPGMVAYFGASSLARAAGDSRTPMMFLAASAVANVILDLLFVVQFGWGVAGSAWATIMSQSSAGVAQLLFFSKRQPLLSFHWRLVGDRQIARRMFQLGGMSAVQQTTVAINMLVLQRFINVQAVVVVSGFVAGSQVDTYGRMAMLSTMIALPPFVSQNLGAGKGQRARQGLACALLFNLFVSLFFFLLMLFFGRHVVGWFNPDPEMTEVGATFLRISSGFYWALSLNFCLIGFLRGCGATAVPMMISVGGAVAVPLFATIYSRSFGYQGLFFVFPSMWCLMMVTLGAYFFTGRWQGKLSTPKIEDEGL